MAPPSGAFDAVTVPPWRSTMALTIDRPRPLPEGHRFWFARSIHLVEAIEHAVGSAPAECQDRCHAL